MHVQLRLPPASCFQPFQKALPAPATPAAALPSTASPTPSAPPSTPSAPSAPSHNAAGATPAAAAAAAAAELPEPKRAKKMVPVTRREKADDLCNRALGKATEASKLKKALAGVPYGEDLHAEMGNFEEKFTSDAQHVSVVADGT